MSESTDPTIAIDEVDTSHARRNPLIVVLTAIAAAGIGVLVWLFVVAPLFGGDDAEVAFSTTAVGESAAEAPTTEAPLDEPVDAAAELPLMTYEVFLARDPFDPVVPEPEPEVEPTAAAVDEGEDEDGDDGRTEDGTSEFEGGGPTGDGASTDAVVEGGAPEGDSPVRACRGEDELVCDGRVVSLVDITEKDGELVAVIQVDTTVYEVVEGEVFASNFLVQKLTAEQVTLVYGDDVVPLREGDRVLK